MSAIPCQRAAGRPSALSPWRHMPSVVCVSRRSAVPSLGMLPARQAGPCQQPPNTRLRLVPASAASSDAPTLRGLYPSSSKPLQSGFLETGSQHRVWYEVHGNKDGVPALFLHGGPGAGCYPNHMRFFDPSAYKIVLMDQRGCGQSTPRGCLTDNNTPALVADIELLRTKLDITRFGVVLGGSWGVALALAYAQAHPTSVAGIILRGVCTMRQSELDWVFGNPAGAAVIRPWGYARWLDHLTSEEQATPLQSYYRRLLSSDAEVRETAARAWMEWDGCLFATSAKQLSVWGGAEWKSASPGSLPPSLTPTPTHSATSPKTPAAPNSATPVAPASASDPSSNDELLQRGLRFAGNPSMSSSAAQALLEAHYCLHAAFLAPSQLIAGVGPALRAIPAVAIQGQADLCTPPGTAYALHRAWPELQLRLVPDAGHSMYDPAITHELVQATDAFRDAFLAGEGGSSDNAGLTSGVEREVLTVAC